MKFGDKSHQELDYTSPIRHTRGACTYHGGSQVALKALGNDMSVIQRFSEPQKWFKVSSHKRALSLQITKATSLFLRWCTELLVMPNSLPLHGDMFPFLTIIGVPQIIRSVKLEIRDIQGQVCYSFTTKNPPTFKILTNHHAIAQLATMLWLGYMEIVAPSHHGPICTKYWKHFSRHDVRIEERDSRKLSTQALSFQKQGRKAKGVHRCLPYCLAGTHHSCQRACQRHLKCLLVVKSPSMVVLAIWLDLLRT